MYTRKEIENGIGAIQHERSTKVWELVVDGKPTGQFDTISLNETPFFRDASHSYQIVGYISGGKFSEC